MCGGSSVLSALMLGGIVRHGSACNHGYRFVIRIVALFLSSFVFAGSLLDGDRDSRSGRHGSAWLDRDPDPIPFCVTEWRNGLMQAKSMLLSRKECRNPSQ
eukprot:2619314-Amphidinium_carterae.1